MSRIYFHTVNGEAQLYGSERAYLGGLCTDIAWSIIKPAYLSELDGCAWVPDAVKTRIAEREPYWSIDLDTWFRTTHFNFGRGDTRVIFQGERYDGMDIALNTASALSDTLRLAAFIHGRCESHGFFEKAEHGFVYKLIENARTTDTFRAGQGWEDLLELLRVAESPVVMSYSVCETYPNDVDVPVIDKQTPERHWLRALDTLRKTPWLSFDGEGEDYYNFANAPTAFDIKAVEWSKRTAERPTPMEPT
jgi:hypothetical protein